jgi:hypothetical protein
MQDVGGARHFSLNVLFQSCSFTSFLTNGGMISWVRAMHYLNIVQGILLHLLGHFCYYTFFLYISWQTDVGGCLCKLYPKQNFGLKIKYDRRACKIFHVCPNSPHTQLKLTVIEKHESGKLLSLSHCMICNAAMHVKNIFANTLLPSRWFWFNPYA